MVTSELGEFIKRICSQFDCKVKKKHNSKVFKVAPQTYILSLSKMFKQLKQKLAAYALLALMSLVTGGVLLITAAVTSDAPQDSYNPFNNESSEVQRNGN